MEQLMDFIKNNPKMKLKEISKIYKVSVSAISKRRASLGIKHETSALCKKIFELLHLRNKDIATQLGCSEMLVAHVRFKNNKGKTTQRVDLTEEQIEMVKANYDKMSILKLADKIGVTSHVLRSRMAEMKLYNDMDNSGKYYDYDLDDGNGFFDLEKYKKVML